MAIKRNYKKWLKLILTLLLLVIALIGGRGINPAFAVTYGNSNVLQDLQKDGSFNISDYPDKAEDYSIKVIQIAESSKNELFLYTYQPCQKTKYLIATDINMSQSEHVDGTRLYELILINTNGVFAKYLVKDIKVSESAIRYYNITSIYRAWDKELDGETGNNNTGEKKAFEVRNIYRVTDENGDKKYFCEPTYTVNIINPYSDYLLYLTASSLPSIPSIKFNFERMGMIDAHYIAFSTEWEIDKLKSATVTYQSSSGVGHYNTFLGFDCGGDISYTDPQTGYAYPTYSDRAEYSGDFWHSGRDYSYTWDRIQTVPEFLATEKNLTDETKSNLDGKQWVLRFLETERTQTETSILGYKKYTTEFTKVDKVAVLRLEFETDGIAYNLGTVADVVSGDDLPGNVEPKPDEQSIWKNIGEFFINLFNKIKGFAWWQWLLLVLGVILGIGLIISLIMFGIKAIFKGIGYLIKCLFKGLWWLISLPFRAISKLSGKRKKNVKD